MKFLLRTLCLVMLFCLPLVQSSLARKPSGLLFIGRADSNMITVYDSHSLLKLSEIRTGSYPSLMQISHTGDSLYVISARDAVLDRVDVDSLLVTSRVNLPKGTRWFVFSEDRRYLLAATSGLERIYYLDLQSAEPEHPLQILQLQSPYPVTDITPGKEARATRVGLAPLSVDQYELWQQLTANRYAGSDNATQLPSVGDLEMPEQLAISTSGRVAYLARSDRKKVAVMDIHNRNVVAAIPTEQPAVALSLGHDQRQLYIADAGGKLSVVDTSNRQTIRQVKLGFEPVSLLVDN